MSANERYFYHLLVAQLERFVLCIHSWQAPGRCRVGIMQESMWQESDYWKPYSRTNQKLRLLITPTEWGRGREERAQHISIPDTNSR